MTSTVRFTPQPKTESVRPPTIVKALAALLALLTIGCLQGGIAMILDPEEPLGMSKTYLDTVPIDTYLWPGIFLVCLGVASGITAVGLVTHWTWRWAGPIERSLRHRWPWLGALATGGVLLAFEIVELFVVPFHPIMHPLLIGVAVAILGLSLAPTTRSRFSVDQR